LKRAASRTLASELKDPLEFSIIERLIEGPRTAAELVEEIFSITRDGPGYMTSYTRVRRSLGGLSSRGYVSRKIFGTSKPFRLTHYAIGRLTSFAAGDEPPQVLPNIDRIIHLITLLLLAVVLLSASGRLAIEGMWINILNSLCYFSLGISATRIAQGFWRVV
jgi:hypothetical protein